LASKLGIQFSTEKDESHSHTLVFTSWRKDVDVILAGLDIVTLTSFNEGTPVSLIEAQAANKPIVSTRVGGIADVVIEGKTALLSNIDEGEAFCDNLLRMVEDERLRLRMGEGAGSHVFEKYSYQRLVKDMSDLYYELLAEKLQTNAVLR
jgi:glycosyltransferase involved in cell wall biosynthesis